MPRPAAPSASALPRRPRHPLAALLATCGLLLAACGGGGGGGGAFGGSVTTPATLPTISLSPVAQGFSAPLQLAHAGDGSGRLFVVEKGGLVRVISNGAVQPLPFLDLTGIVQAAGSEQGLLGIAFAPQFAQNRRFYVHYTGRFGVTGDTVLARYRAPAGSVADPATATTLLTVAQPFSNHNGGQLAFGPDGFLYVGLGDGGGGDDPQDNAQNLGTLLGKLLRLDVEGGAPTYSIPFSNPFGNEIWAYGLRNPWRFSFDRQDGTLYIGDVGQDAFEEIDVQPAGIAGANYGWRVMEGPDCNIPASGCSRAGLTLPVASYAHGSGDCSVTGGHVYRGSAHPALQGVYLYGDFCSGRIWGLRQQNGVWTSQLLLDSPYQISSFGEDESGELYVVDYGGGAVYRVGVP